MYPRIHLGVSELRSIIDAEHHYIEAPRAELYDLVRDANETRNILADERRVAAELKRAVAATVCAASRNGRGRGPQAFGTRLHRVDVA